MIELNIDLGRVRAKLSAKNAIGVNTCYEKDNESATRGYFLRRSDSRFSVCYDDYRVNCEDAVDLYFSYVRASFSNLCDAVAFSLNGGMVCADDLVR
ncbi:hypothetical protein [Burkholderia sp. F1]|uniref:hypothetical protein n=1 Tax=Burkholderia sp. F1 TaxID=3366817 RepID=UPI003D743E3D